MISTCPKCNSAIFSNDGKCEFGCDAPEVHAQFTPGSERPVSDNPESREIGTPAQSVHAERTAGSNPASQSTVSGMFDLWLELKSDWSNDNPSDDVFIIRRTQIAGLRIAFEDGHSNANSALETLRIDLASMTDERNDAQRALEAVSLRYAKLLEKVADARRALGGDV